jgi:hypothetical protein
LDRKPVPWDTPQTNVGIFAFLLDVVWEFAQVPLITIVMEWLAIRVLGRWAYAETMPVVPLLGVGVAPFVQWIVLPPLVVWFVRQQLT